MCHSRLVKVRFHQASNKCAATEGSRRFRNWLGSGVTSMCQARFDKIRFHQASNNCAAREGSSALCHAPDRIEGQLAHPHCPPSCTRCATKGHAGRTPRAPHLPQRLQNWLVSGVTSMCHSRFDRSRFHRASNNCAATDSSRALCRRLCCDASTWTANWTCRELARSHVFST